MHLRISCSRNWLFATAKSLVSACAHCFMNIYVGKLGFHEQNAVHLLQNWRLFDVAPVKWVLHETL